ncbi:MAG: AI-2E family transporter [Chloroflexota bacterium]|nr:AI-2E family transporter [Chloroflexota bacterium]
MSAIHFSARTKAALIWGGVLLALAFLYLVGSIVTPFIWAAVTAYILNALVRVAQRRIGGPRPLWAVLIYFGLVLGLIWGLTNVVPLLVAQVRQIVSEVPNYVRQVTVFLQANNINLGGGRVTEAQITDTTRRALSDVMGLLGTRAPELARNLFEGLLHILIYLLATFFILLGAPKTVSNFRSLFSPPVLDELDPWFQRINHTLISYLRGQLLLIGVVSIATYIGLSILGVQFALALAIMSGLVETIPYLGPYAAGAIAVLVGLTQTQPNHFGWPPLMLGAAVAILYTIIRQTEDNLVMPVVIGRTVELHPLTVLFMVLAGASVAGVLGLLIAVPVAATVKIMAEFMWLKIQEPNVPEAPETETGIRVGPIATEPEPVTLAPIAGGPLPARDPRAGDSGRAAPPAPGHA